MKDNRKTIQLLLIFTVIFSVIGGSLAYWNWNTEEGQQTNVVFTVTSDFSCAADGGGNITSSDVSLAPTTCTDTSRAIKRKITVTPTINNDSVNMDMYLWLNVNDIGSGLSESTKFRYVLTTSDSSCEEGTIMASGNFNGKTIDDKIMLLDKRQYTKTSIVPEEYYLYIWLDEKETNSNTMNQTFSLSLGGECSDNPYKDTAYAIYSADDNSLTFYRSDEEITAGSTYNGKTATAVYTGFEDETYTTGTEVPWNNYNSTITSVSFEDEIVPRNTAYWFSGFESCNSISNLSNLDTSNVTDMSSMFRYYALFKEIEGIITLDLSMLNVSNVTNMSNMFNSVGAAAMMTPSITLDLSNWNTSNVTDMSGMFNDLGEGISSIEIIGMENWDTSSVTDMSNMFYFMAYYIDDSDKIKIGDLGKWDVSNVKNMSKMFQMVGAVSPLPLSDVFNISNWNVSNVENMSEMFSSTNIGDIDLSKWDVSKVTNMSGMFKYVALGSNDSVGRISDWDTSSVTNMSSMFEYATIDSGNSKTDISNWNTSNVTDMSNMFKGLTIIDTYDYIGVHNIDLSKWDVSNVTNYNGFNSSITNQTSGSFIAPNFGS